MSRKRFVGVTFGILLLSGLGYSTFRLVGQREGQSCKACGRPVHSHSRTVARIDGNRGVYCCPACALSEHQQAGTPIEVVELTDYATSQSLDPRKAWVVRNSDVNPCLRHDAVLSPDKQPLHSHFDRCAPSMLAFGSSSAAQSFVREHGGQVVAFSDLASTFRH